MTLCCAPGCWARNATDYSGVPLCPGHADAVARTLPPPQPKPVVYYITRADKPGLVKIGTTKNLRTRLQALSARGRPVTLLATEPGGIAVEFERHTQFAAMRAEGEWFTYAAPLIAHVHRLTPQ